MDTHVALWWAQDDAQLSPQHRGLLESSTGEIYLSVVSCWETSIKAAQGKLRLDREPRKFFQELAAHYDFKVLPVHLSHAGEVFHLPKVHNDPFDRLLIAQCRSEKMVMLSDDAIFEKYELPGLISRSRGAV